MDRDLHQHRKPGVCGCCCSDAKVRPVMFWVNGLRMLMCAVCEREMKGSLLR